MKQEAKYAQLAVVPKVLVWDEKVEQTRRNEPCIARVSGCIRLNGNTEVKIEYEKGEGELGVDIVDTPIHETAKNIRLRYKGAEALVMLQADMTAALTRSMGEDTVSRRWHGTRVLA